MPDGKPPTYEALLELCTEALAQEHHVTAADDVELCRDDVHVVLDELVDSGVLVTAERFDEDCHKCERRIGDHLADGRCPPVPAWDAWTEPDVAVVDELTRWGVHAADRISIDLHATNLTGHERTREATRGAIRLLLANSLIRDTLPPDGEQVSVWMDPPGGWNLPTETTVPPPPTR